MTCASAATGSWTVAQFYYLLKMDSPTVLLLAQLAIEQCEYSIPSCINRACHVFVTFVCAEKLRVSRIRDNGPQRVKSHHIVEIFPAPLNHCPPCYCQ